MARSVLVWLLFLIISLSAIVFVATRLDAHLHAIMASIIAIVWASLGIASNWSRRNDGASEFQVAASTAQDMGFVWGWGALAILLTYGFVIQWKEWLVFGSAAAVIAVICLALGYLLQRDSEKAGSDETMLNLAWYLTVGQLVGMVIAAIGLFVDGKIPAHVKESTAHQAWQDWAANNIFFYGALVLICISANALYSMRTKRSA